MEETIYKFAGLSIEDWRNLALIGGVCIASFGAYIGWRNMNLSKAAANMDRYQKGAQMLGDDRMSVRQAGIIILHQLAKAEPKGFAIMCAELLEKFVIDRGEEVLAAHKVEEKEKGDAANPPRIAADAQSALDALIEIRKESGTAVQLEDAYLVGAKLTGAHFVGANLEDSNLERAILNRANLERANLWNANLQGAYLKRANLRLADITDAEITWRQLNKAESIDGAVGLPP